MRAPIRGERYLRIALQYLLAAGLCAVILSVFLKLPQSNLHVPLHYNGDALLHTSFIKGVIDNGWYWENNYLGAPYGLKMYDFPAADNLPMLIIKLMTLFTADPMVVLNLFYLLTFPLVTMSAVFALRQFGFSYLISLFTGLLYTFMPYHFMRGESHLFLAAYYLVPLAVMVVLWTSSGSFYVSEQLRLRSYQAIVSLIVCILVGSSGFYYPFFTCFLLVVAGGLASFRSKSFKALIPATVLVGVIAVTVAVNMVPSIWYLYRNGNPQVTKRAAAESETYGFKIAQLVLPITGHRVRAFRALKQKYNYTPLVTENDTASLGLVGTVGFLALVVHLFVRSRKPASADSIQPETLFDDLTSLSMAAVLLGTIGGVGSLIAHVLFTAVRSVNRISIFIAFFSLFTVAIFLQKLLKKATTPVTRAAFYVGLALLLTIGFLDQTGKHFVPNYVETKASFSSDAAFVRTIEATVPPNGMIFQLPYVPFPEHPRFNKMIDYDLFRGYVHSHHLRWSYGAMKFREGDVWQREMDALPTDRFVERLGFAGFSGVYLDRFGYSDNGSAKEKELSDVLRVSPTVSEDGRLAFFDMATFNAQLREQHRDDWPAKQDLALHPLLLTWRGGFSGLEVAEGKNWRWSSAEGELQLNNSAEHPRTISVEMEFATGYDEESDLSIKGSLISEQLKISAKPLSYSKTLVVAPGISAITFTSNAKRVNAPLDPRTLVFRIENFRVKQVD